MVSSGVDRRGCQKRGCRRPALWSLALAGLALSCLMAGAGGVAAAAAPDRAGPAATNATSPLAAGQSLFEEDCASCHGPQGLGGLSFGSVRSADIRGGHLRTLEPPYTEALLSRAITDGVDQHGGRLNSAMPRWKGMLSPQQTRWVAAYLWSLGVTPAQATPGAAHTAPAAPIIETAAMVVVIAGAAAATRRWTA